jgi:transcriptional regulator with PAS, ATPase and Fis domain
VSKKAHEDGSTLPGEAIEFLTGAALVLDADLRVRLVTPGVHQLLGFPVPLGAAASKILCGDAPKRPVADALAAGRPIQAVISRPVGPDQTRLIRVRSAPLPGADGTRGWLLLLEESAGAEGNQPVLFHGMWTREPRMKELFRILSRIAAADVTVLVRGETGTGKELVARAVHDLSPRRAGPFRAINCAALPGNLLESELFGHVKGAFTGAHKDTPGHMQLAHRGTLFLDEVAELPLELQAKLLRVLETRSVIPVGARDPIPVDLRIVSATHRALRREVEAGRFRADLMYRLRVIPLFLPALRERRADLPLLCDRLCAEMNTTWARQISAVSPAALAVLERHDWPGNIRELKNVLAYAYAIGDGPTLQASDLPPELFEQDSAQAAPVWVTNDHDEAPQPAEKRRIQEVLERAGGSRERAAKILGLSRVTLWRRMKQYGIASGDEES